MANIGAGHVKLPPDFDLQSQQAAAEWKFWRTAFEDYLVATGQHEAHGSVKLSILRNIIGTESARIMSTFIIPENEANKYTYVMGLIEQYVNPRVNECYERYIFLKRTQKEGESFEHFLTECRHLVRTCNYNAVDGNATPEDKALRDKIVMGIRDPVTREALLRIDQLTLDKAVNFCRTSEQSKNQSLKFQEQEENVNFVRKHKKKPEVSEYKEKYNNQKFQKKYEESSSQSTKFKCKRCQSLHGPRECPAFGKKCNKCGLLNHFAISCKVRNTTVRNIEKQSHGESSEEDVFVGNVGTGARVSAWEEYLYIEDKKFKIRLDTGADVSVMPIRIFKCINKQFKIRPTTYILKGFEGTSAKTIGICNLHCKYKGRDTYEDFVVVEGATQILLSGQACTKLSLIKRINNINNISLNDNSVRKDAFIQKNFEIFKGFGRFPGKHNITVKENFEAVSRPPTKVPLAIRDELKKELDRLVDRKAIVKVEEMSPMASINRIVVVEKPNGKLRLCLDPSDLNSQIIRKPNVGLNIEEVCSNLVDKKVFTVFDLAEGYHHLELNEESSWKCCFATSFGIYRFIVLPYGLSNAQDLFQEEVQKHFTGIKNVLICHDDMICSGANKEEHDIAVSEVIKRAKEVNAKFNKDKLQFCKDRVKFMGHIFSQSGMQIDEDRVESLKKLRPPTNKVELQRILGSFNYVRRYVKNMSELMHPLCELLKNNVEFSWLPKHQEVFDKLKTIISQSPALVPFDFKKKIVLQCDASKNALGCCLFQQYDNNLLKLVACASRTMNDFEVNYSQTEKEMLAIYFGCQKYHDFIYKNNVDVQSDHKPIISIMKKPIYSIGSVRLQRLRLKLLKYSLNVYYVPGKNVQFADMLSRSSLKGDNRPDPDMFEMVHSVTKHLPMSDLKKDQFRLETSKDQTLSTIFDFYYNGWPKSSVLPQNVKPYLPLKNSIYVEAGIILVEDKIIVPQTLRIEMIKLLHKGHVGISKTINKARKLFYWPNMSFDITSFIKKCRVCEKYMPANFREPMMPHSTPRLRFNKVGTDILDFGNHSYLVVIDYFSHWLELILLKDKTSDSVLNAFQDIFTRFGYPQIIIADNLPFISNRCLKYYREKDISIKTCSPHYHQSNGMAEKAVSISKQILRKCHEDKTDFRECILEYNNSPIVHLDASPAQILQSRNLKSQIPVTMKTLEPRVQAHIYNKLLAQTEIVKTNYDRLVRRKPQEFVKGDKVVIRCKNDSIWSKGIIVEKAPEPRSYWVKKENNNQIVRRNTSQIKLSKTKSDYRFINEPELFPDNKLINNDVNQPNFIPYSPSSSSSSIATLSNYNSCNNHSNPSSPYMSSESSRSEVSVRSEDNRSHSGYSNRKRSRYGRIVKPPRHYELYTSYESDSSS